MSNYNSTPEFMTELTEYGQILHFFTWPITNIESRQPQYTENFIDGQYNLRIFWISGTDNLGYAIMKDWKAEKIRWFRVGSNEDWKTFNMAAVAQFSHDNS